MPSFPPSHSFTPPSSPPPRTPPNLRSGERTTEAILARSKNRLCTCGRQSRCDHRRGWCMICGWTTCSRWCDPEPLTFHRFSQCRVSRCLLSVFSLSLSLSSESPFRRNHNPRIMRIGGPTRTTRTWPPSFCPATA